MMAGTFLCHLGDSHTNHWRLLNHHTLIGREAKGFGHIFAICNDFGVFVVIQKDAWMILNFVS